MYLHGYICECGDRRCRERIRLTPARYSELAQHGTIVSPYCAHGRTVVLSEPGVRVVTTAFGPLGETRMEHA